MLIFASLSMALILACLLLASSSHVDGTSKDKKTEHYKTIVEQAAEARPGVLKLMDEALDHPDVAVCICSAATKEGFIKVVKQVSDGD